jgi:hypothetical protein
MPSAVAFFISNDYRRRLCRLSLPLLPSMSLPPPPLPLSLLLPPLPLLSSAAVVVITTVAAIFNVAAVFNIAAIVIVLAAVVTVVVYGVLLPSIALNCLPGCCTKMFNCSGILD